MENENKLKTNKKYQILKFRFVTLIKSINK